MSQRKQYFIDSKVQSALLRRLMMHWALMLLSLVSLGVLVQIFFGPANTTFFGAIRDSFGKQLPLLILMFVLVPVYLQDVVRLSHRFAGPMYRLRTILRSMADGGRGGKLRFRPGDFWHETATDFNRFYEKHVELQQRCASLEKQLRERAGKEELRVEQPV